MPVMRRARHHRSPCQLSRLALRPLRSRDYRLLCSGAGDLAHGRRDLGRRDRLSGDRARRRAGAALARDRLPQRRPDRVRPRRRDRRRPPAPTLADAVRRSRPRRVVVHRRDPLAERRARALAPRRLRGIHRSVPARRSSSPSYTALSPRLVPEQQLLAANGLEGMPAPARGVRGRAGAGRPRRRRCSRRVPRSSPTRPRYRLRRLPERDQSRRPGRARAGNSGVRAALADLREAGRYVRKHTRGCGRRSAFALITVSGPDRPDRRARAVRRPRPSRRRRDRVRRAARGVWRRRGGRGAAGSARDRCHAAT